MLFLDEIHRLPPEGQEMIFYFMDHGTFSRLGETGKIIKPMFASSEQLLRIPIRHCWTLLLGEFRSISNCRF